jgi:hypothetical protein
MKAASDKRESEIVELKKKGESY